MLSELDRQLYHFWRRRFQGRDAGSPRIAVVGNCQSFGVAYAMKTLNPAARVDRFTIIRKGLATVDMLARALATYDHVFSIHFPKGYLRDGGFEQLRERLPNVRLLPSLVFSGYHPDLVYILDPTAGGRPLDGPIGSYHSAIALYAYLRGMNLEQAEALFSAQVYDALGYFDVWESAAAELLGLARAAGVDLSAEFMRWSRGVPFMYSINHPKPFVLFDLARVLLRKAGLPAADLPFDLYAVDDVVRGVVFPVYPEIAERYGQTGSYLFKRAHFELESGVGDFFDLPGFLKASFAAYGACKPAQLVTPRTQAWLDDAETRRLFDFHAADALARKYAHA